ncbi:uncharacterized protein METZ01_LOCUS489379 [marine metagenome]|uniref:Uncharacterized protein n=1 Tax=marine metagenome TaxID=408172 RepID=A0A383CX93_9ZZZZ
MTLNLFYKLRLWVNRSQTIWLGIAQINQRL